MSTDASPSRRLLLMPSHRQIQQLLWADIRDPAGCLRLREDLAPADLTASVYLANARRFLSLMGESGIPATAKGNLGRAFALAMNERMRFSDYDGEWRPYIKVHKEDDVWPLHVLRHVQPWPPGPLPRRFHLPEHRGLQPLDDETHRR